MNAFSKILKSSSSSTKPLLRYVSVRNIPSPYRIPQFEEICRQLKDRGIEYHVDFMAHTHKGRPRSWLNPKMNIPYKYWLDLGFGEHHFNPGLVINLLLHPPEFLELGSPYDTFTCILLALFCKAKKKIMILEGNTKTPGKIDGLLGMFKRFILSKATYLAVPGHDAQRFIALHQHRTMRKLGKTPILPNLIDETMFKPREWWTDDELDKARKALGCDGYDRVCIVPARLIRVKGLLEFVEALEPKSLIDWRIVILGQGELRDKIQKMISDKHIDDKVSILEYVDYNEMPKYYAASDLMLLPSIQDMNPLCVVEALFTGLPVALSNMVGNVEEGVSEGRNGWVLPVLDKDMYRQKLIEVFSTSRERLKGMGKVSQSENALFWSAKPAVKRYLDVVVGEK